MQKKLIWHIFYYFFWLSSEIFSLFWQHLYLRRERVKSGISQIRKKFQNSEIPRIMALFLDLQNSTFKYPYRPKEVPLFLPPTVGALTHIRFTATARKNRNTLLVILGYLEMEFCKSKKSAKILRSSGFWHFFKICKIPLLSILTGHVKWNSSFSIQM